MKRISIDLAAGSSSSAVDNPEGGEVASPRPTGASDVLVQVLGTLMQTVALMDPRAADQLRGALQTISQDLFVRGDAAGLDTLAALGRAAPAVAPLSAEQPDGRDANGDPAHKPKSVFSHEKTRS